MAAQQTEQIRVGANGKIMVAEVGTTAPASEAAAWPAGWTELGFTNENGVTVTDAKTITDIAVWQLFYPARKVVASRNFTAAFGLREWSEATVSLAFGGGTFEEVTAGHFKYTPPPPEDVDERALGVEWVDGDLIYRLIVPRGLVTENVATQLQRTAAADLPITFGVIGEGGVDPWYLLTNDPALEPVGS